MRKCVLAVALISVFGMSLASAASYPPGDSEYPPPSGITPIVDGWSYDDSILNAPYVDVYGDVYNLQANLSIGVLRIYASNGALLAEKPLDAETIAFIRETAGEAEWAKGTLVAGIVVAVIGGLVIWGIDTIWDEYSTEQQCQQNSIARNNALVSAMRACVLNGKDFVHELSRPDDCGTGGSVNCVPR